MKITALRALAVTGLLAGTTLGGVAPAAAAPSGEQRYVVLYEDSATAARRAVAAAGGTVVSENAAVGVATVRGQVRFKTYLRDAGGLDADTSVLFGGIKVGQVTRVGPDTDDPTCGMRMRRVMHRSSTLPSTSGIQETRHASHR